MTHSFSLPQLGWHIFFQQQLSLEEWEHCRVARVTAQERSLLQVLSENGIHSLDITPGMPAITVGDWIVLEGSGRFHRALERSSLFTRKAAGTKVAVQLIAANIDTVFVVCSMNQDFNLNRIERYLILANDSRIESVVVLSKLDCCSNPREYMRQVQALDPLQEVVSVNCLDSDSVSQLLPWCGAGRTVALLGSSGVGKSTLTNTLSGKPVQRTHSIRGDDDKGRHTTSGRSLHILPSGGILLDTPGMRELQLAGTELGVEKTFPEIVELAQNCRFNDCKHENEPGCQVQAAISGGQLDGRRLTSYQKLMKEQAFNQATLSEKRSRDRKLGRFYRSVQTAKRHNSSG